ncbi:MAG: hypothetical protein IJZ72_09400 [Oscillospiraceae bacterium]|nr:hypothetical protein [Oscillospiraceae bacterium]
MTETIITSSVIISVILILRLILKGKVRHRVIYGLWLVAAIRLMLPFSLAESSVSIMNLFKEAAPQAYETETVYTQPVYENISPDIKPPEPSEPTEEYIAPAIVHEVTAAAPEMKREINFAEVFKVIWAVGSVVILLWFGGVNTAFYFNLKCKREKFDCGIPLRVFTVNGLKSPCIFGLFRPSVYITEEAAEDKDKLEFIITHELCHYRHGDMIWAFLRNILLAVYWVNPLVWAAAFISKRDCELACDEAAVQTLGEDKRIAYGQALVDMVAQKRTAADLIVASTSMSDGSGLKERIKSIAGKPKYSAAAVIVLVLAVLVTAGCTFTSAKDEQPTGTDSIQSEDVPVEEVEAQRLLEEQAEFQRELEESRQKAMLELQESFVVYEFGITAGGRGYNIKVRTGKDYTVENDVVISNYSLYAYDETGGLVSNIGLPTGAVGLDGTKFDLNRAEEYFKFSKGSTIVFSPPAGDGAYLAGFFGFEPSGGFFQYNIKDSNRFSDGFPQNIRASTHEMFIGENFTFSKEAPGIDDMLFSGTTYFTDHNGEKVIYIADFDSRTKTVRSEYCHCDGYTGGSEISIDGMELLEKLKEEDFISQEFYESELESISTLFLMLYEKELASIRVQVGTTEVPDENGFIYGHYYIRTYGKSSGRLIDEIPLTSGAVGMDGLAIDIYNILEYFRFDAHSDDLVVFSYPLRKSADDENARYLCSFYGVTDEGELFEYSTEDIDIDIYHGKNQLEVGSNSRITELYYPNETTGEYRVFRGLIGNRSENRNGEEYTSLYEIRFNPDTKSAELMYHYEGAYDEEIAAAAERAAFVKQLILSFSVFTPLEDENTVIEEYDADGAYYQFDTSVATTKEELVSYISDTFTEDTVTGYKDFEHELFGTEPPNYKMIDGKLCYLAMYSGVPTRAMNDVPYVVQKNGDTASVYILCRGLDFYDVLECKLEKSDDGKWRTSSMNYIAM